SYISKYASKSEGQEPDFLTMLSNIARAVDDATPILGICRKLLNKMLGERTYSSQETAHLLLGLPLVRASSGFETLYLGTDGSMRELSMVDLPEGAGDDDEGGGRVATGESVLQRFVWSSSVYMKRPPNMEDMSLLHVLMHFRWTKGSWRKRRASDHPVVIRVYPRPSPDPEGDEFEEYCRIKMQLHHPFRTLDGILTESGAATWSAAYRACCHSDHTHPTDTLRVWADESREVVEEGAEDDDDEWMLDETEELPEEDWQLYAHIHPDVEPDLYDLTRLGLRDFDNTYDVEASRTRWDRLDEMGSYLAEQRRLEAEAQEEVMVGGGIDYDPGPAPQFPLSEEQQVIYERYVDAYTRILAGERVPQMLLNIDGTAGCGKTYLISCVCWRLRTMAQERGLPDPIRVVAPSGVAALNIGGRTLHSSFALPV
ncbi:hypothetical protein FB107DRAFT_173603, partial [Schizophyllum commune]